MIEHGARRLLHLDVTAHPTAAWTLQQLCEALGYEDRYRYLIHDRDGIFAKSLDEPIGRLDRAFYPTLTIVIATYYGLFAVLGGSLEALAAVGSRNSDLNLSGNSDYRGGPAEAPGRTPATDARGGGKDDRHVEASRDSGAAPGQAHADVALANKNARIAWALLAHQREFDPDYLSTAPSR